MKILIIGTINTHLTEAAQIAIKNGAKVSICHSHEEAMNIVRHGESFDACIVDVKTNIPDLIHAFEQERIYMTVLACGTAGSNEEDIIKAIKAGAKEYIPLPPDPELITAILEAITEEHHSFIAHDTKTKDLMELAKRIAPSRANVLITGNSGTGKEVFARYIHERSNRKNEKFIALNCAAIPDTLLESELFGHEKGAFSGATARRIGKFEEAQKGTILLDEISEMSPNLQAKILRAIQEKQIDRIGGSSPIKIDVRILATSNRDLLKHISDGLFREDLYFRLNVISLHLPDLKDRPGDIRHLSHYFLEKYSKLNGIPLKEFAKSTLDKLCAYHWPGNIRELENTIHRAVLLETQPMILENSLRLPEQGKDHHEIPTTSLAEIERHAILGTLNHCLGNKTKTAGILGISIRTLRNKLKLYDISA